jgi:arsenite transporter
MVAGVVLVQIALSLVTHFGRRSSVKTTISICRSTCHLADDRTMMMKVDFASIRHVGVRPTGLVTTLFVKWVVKPFSTAFFA